MKTFGLFPASVWGVASACVAFLGVQRLGGRSYSWKSRARCPELKPEARSIGIAPGVQIKHQGPSQAQGTKSSPRRPKQAAGDQTKRQGTTSSPRGANQAPGVQAKRRIPNQAPGDQSKPQGTTSSARGPHQAPGMQIKHQGCSQCCTAAGG